MRIAIGSDHAGYELKAYLGQMLAGEHDVVDIGTDCPDSVDYPDYAVKVARLVAGRPGRARHPCVRHGHRHVGRGE